MCDVIVIPDMKAWSFLSLGYKFSNMYCRNANSWLSMIYLDPIAYVDDFLEALFIRLTNGPTSIDVLTLDLIVQVLVSYPTILSFWVELSSYNMFGLVCILTILFAF